MPYYDPGVVYGGWPYRRLSALLFRDAGLYRRRPPCGRARLRRGLCAWELGGWRVSLGRRLQLASRQHLRQSRCEHQQRERQKLDSRSGPPARRAIRQSCRRTKIRRRPQHRRRRADAHGFSRPGRPAMLQPERRQSAHRGGRRRASQSPERREPTPNTRLSSGRQSIARRSTGRRASTAPVNHLRALIPTAPAAYVRRLPPAMHSATSARETAPCLIQTAASPVSAAAFTAAFDGGGFGGGGFHGGGFGGGGFHGGGFGGGGFHGGGGRPHDAAQGPRFLLRQD